MLKNIDCKFVGSFYALDQTPKDHLPQVAFAGRSNVGKSTLLNKLVGQRKMAKVSSTPGKTRALNFFLVNNRFYFVDLPGYGFAKVPARVRESWGELIERYLTESVDLKGLVLLLDCRREASGEDLELIDWLARRELPTLMVVTKLDKLNRDKANRKIRQVETQLGLPAIGFSSQTGVGKKELLAAVFDLIENET